MMRILVLHGPNPGAPGSREPAIQGRAGLGDTRHRLGASAARPGGIECRRAAHGGVPADALDSAKARADGIFLVPGGLSRTSVAPRDSVPAPGFPIVEVHLNDPDAREVFRHTSLSSGAAVGAAQGFGPAGCELAPRGLVGVLSGEDE